MKHTTLLALLLALVAATLFTPSARGHDFWVEPSTFAPQAGDRVALRLKVGDHFSGSPYPRDPTHFHRFELFDGNGGQPIQGVDGADPAGVLPVLEAGTTMTVVYESDPRVARLTPARLSQYLREEGLEAVVGSVAGKTVTDHFSRHVKVLLQPEGGTLGGIDGPTGMTLELVPGVNPYSLDGGGSLPMTLLYRGEVLPGATVVALRADGAGQARALTDRNGSVAFDVGPGAWLVKAVWAEASGGGASLRSYWTALTFEISAD